MTGNAWGDWASYTDSPLRAFENELGVQAVGGKQDLLDWNESSKNMSYIVFFMLCHFVRKFEINILES